MCLDSEQAAVPDRAGLLPLQLMVHLALPCGVDKAC